MSIANHEEHGVNPRDRPSIDPLMAVPIKKRRFMLATYTSTPCHAELSPVFCDVPQKSSDPESSISDGSNEPASGVALTSSNFPSDAEGKNAINLAPDQESFPRSVDTELNPTVTDEEKVKKKGLDPENISASHSVRGATQLQLLEEPLDLPAEANVEGKPVARDAPTSSRISGNADFHLALKETVCTPKDGQNSKQFSVKQEKLDSCSWNLPLAERGENFQSKSHNAQLKIDSAHFDRSKWDLNTTMDTWPGPLQLAVENEITGCSAVVEAKDVIQAGLQAAPDMSKDIGSKATSSKWAHEKSDHLPESSNLSKPTNPGSSSEACLDLQLKPASVADPFFQFESPSPSGKPVVSGELPVLSLSMEPLSSICDRTLVACKSVKVEPNEECSKKGDGKTEVDGLRPAGEKRVKPEHCVGNESPKVTNPSIKSTCSLTVKLEPFEGQPQEFVNQPEPPSVAEKVVVMPHDVSGLPKSSICPVTQNVSLLHNGLDIPTAGLRQDHIQTVDDAPELVTQASGPDTCEPEHGGNLFATTANGHEIVSESSNLLQHVVSKDEKLKIVEEVSLAGLVTDPPDSVLPDFAKHAVSNVMSDVNLTKELVIESDQKPEVAENSKEKLEPSANSLDKLRFHEEELNSSIDISGTVVTVHKPRDDDFEDGEVRDPALLNGVEGSSENKTVQVEVADLICPGDVLLEFSSRLGLDDSKITNEHSLGTIIYDGSQHKQKNDPENTNTSELLQPSAEALLPAAVADKKKVGKTAMRKIPRSQLKDKGSESKPKSEGATCTGTIVKGGPDEVCNQQERCIQSDSVLTEVSLSSKTELPIKAGPPNLAKDSASISRIVNLNPGPDRPASENMKFIPGRSISSRIGKERFIAKPPRREKSGSRRMRDEKNRYRPRIFDFERSKDQSGGRCAPEMLHNRSRGDGHLKPLHGDRSSGQEQVLEQVDCSSGSRFPRQMNASEVPITPASDGSIGSSGRMTRDFVGDDLENQPRIPHRRRSPGGRGQIPVGIHIGHHPRRDISPTNYVRRDARDAPDFVPHNREERITRTIQDDIIAASVFSRTRYAQTACNFVNTERRSLSPDQRRDFPISSSRPLARSHHQWSPPRRSPDGFDGPRDIVSCRSPRAIRSVRMRSPHRRPCFPDGLIVRRRGSPTYAPRLVDDAGDIGPSREHDFQRSVRGLQRNPRRLDNIDRREISEEEYFGPMLDDQFAESGDIECVVDRSCGERQERLILDRSFRQRRDVANDENESFRSHADGVSSAAFRYCPDGSEGYHERGSPRDFEGHIRNRLGNRLRGVEEQEESYRYVEEPPGWRDAGANEVRLKRRRVERQ